MVFSFLVGSIQNDCNWGVCIVFRRICLCIVVDVFNDFLRTSVFGAWRDGVSLFLGTFIIFYLLWFLTEKYFRPPPFFSLADKYEFICLAVLFF